MQVEEILLSSPAPLPGTTQFPSPPSPGVRHVISSPSLPPPHGIPLGTLDLLPSGVYEPSVEPVFFHLSSTGAALQDFKAVLGMPHNDTANFYYE